MIGFRQRINKYKVKELMNDFGKTLIDAINYVNLKNEGVYRLYSVLLLPLALLSGVRPVWVGKYRYTIYGQKLIDEIVIVRYPNIKILCRIICSAYYSLINKLRENSVANLEFSLATATCDRLSLLESGFFLVINYNFDSGQNANIMEIMKPIFNKINLQRRYVSSEISTFLITSPVIPSDPNPAYYKNMIILKMRKQRSDIMITDQLLSVLKRITGDISVHVYSSLGNISP